MTPSSNTTNSLYEQSHSPYEQFAKDQGIFVYNPDSMFRAHDHREVTLSCNPISSTNSYSSENDYFTLFKSQKSLFLDFCEYYSKNPHAGVCHSYGLSSYNLSVTKDHDDFKVSGSFQTIQGIQCSLEIIQQFILDHFKNKKKFIFLPLELEQHLQSFYILKTKTKKQKVIDLTDPDTGQFDYNVLKIRKNDFDFHVRPFFQDFINKSNFLTCSLYRHHQHIKESINDTYPFPQVDAHAYKIKWEEELRQYPITPQVIPKRDNADRQTYSLYKEQKLCDISLGDKASHEINLSTIDIHKIPLYHYGGEVFKKIISENPKASSILDSRIPFEALKSFAEFIYLGEKGLKLYFLKKEVQSSSKEEHLNKPNLNELKALLKMAYAFKIQELIDCCTNLFSLLAKLENVQEIADLSNQYQNKHLTRLYQHLYQYSTQQKLLNLEFKV